MTETSKKNIVNLIGISGKIGSGKDTVGNILQYLSAGDELSKTTPNLLADWEYNWYAGTKMGNCQIKKFAGKLKDITCLLLGCTREQLEDREFKEKELGEEWWYYDGHQFGAKKLIPYNHKGNSISDKFLVKLTPRKILQLLGTEAGRQVIHPNIWVNALFADYKESKPPKGDTFDYMHNECIDCKKPFNGYKRQFICNNCYDTHNWSPNWIITDVRFPNEAQAIKDRGGVVIRVNRTYYTQDKKYIIGYDPAETHPSETALDDYKFDHVIENDSSIEDLVEKVKQLKLV